jgi:hypothetical protein
VFAASQMAASTRSPARALPKQPTIRDPHCE